MAKPESTSGSLPIILDRGPQKAKKKIVCVCVREREIFFFEALEGMRLALSRNPRLSQRADFGWRRL